MGRSRSKYPSGDNSSIDSSELSLSLDDESSFHLSDYSISTREDVSPRAPNTRIKFSNISPHSRLDPKLVSPQVPNERIGEKNNNSTAFGSTGSSSSGSPWVDDSGSSSYASSNPSRLHVHANRNEEIRFDEARSRLTTIPNRPRKSAPKVMQPRSDSPSSVCTGKDPSKPIDVTGAQDISFVPSLLEQVRLARLARERSISTPSPRVEWAHKADVPNARIVGLRPSFVEATDLKSVDRNKKHLAMARPVPPVIVPEFCSQDDDISSLGPKLDSAKAILSHQRRHGKHRGDLEYGIIMKKSDNDSRSSGGWIEHRTSLELCLIFSIAASLVALAAMLTFMFTNK
jgi:hypothetical protein